MQYLKLESKVNAWTSYEFENSLFQAQLIDEVIKSNKSPGRLMGVPIAIKDIFNTADYPTEMGSKSWKNLGNTYI